MTTSIAALRGVRPDWRRVLDSLRPSAPTEVGIRRSGSDYTFLTAISPNRYLAMLWKQKTFGGYTLHLLDTWDIQQPLTGTAFNDPSAVQTGAGWLYGSANAATGVVGDYVTWTTPASVTTVAVTVLRAQVCGIWAVTIDSDITAADELPTAQALVARGTLPASALTSGGGSLDPSQRVFDAYQTGSAQDETVLLSSSLASGSHAIKIALTAYANPAATNPPRLSHKSFWSGGASTTKDTPGVTMTQIASLYSNQSGQNAEYAIRAWPHDVPGAYNNYVGNNHGFNSEDSVAFEMDGAPISPADGTTTWGESLVVHRDSTIYHPDIPAPGYLADVLTTYTFDGYGFGIENEITWAYHDIIASVSYLSMLSLGRSFTECTTLGFGEVASLAANDNSVRASAQSALAVAWQTPGHWTAALILTDLSGVAYWSLDPSPALWVQDRADPKVNKIYAGRCTDIELATTGTVWTSSARYVAQWLPDPHSTFSALSEVAPPISDPFADGAIFSPPVAYTLPPVLPRGTPGQTSEQFYARRRCGNLPVGQTVMKLNNVYVTTQNPSAADLEAATEVYLGGHFYPVDQDTALALQDAGYVVEVETA